MAAARTIDKLYAPDISDTNTRVRIQFRVPPLQTLRAFETAVRLRSFTRAADELALTQGAISQHVRNLEAHCGVPLFERARGGAIPTPQAQTLALQIRQGLEVLVRAFGARQKGFTEQRTRDTESVALVLSVLPAFAARWLAPRIARFQAAHPWIDLQIRPSAVLARFDKRDQVDVALRYGLGNWPGLRSVKLMDEEVFPVASPLYRGGKLPHRYSDLSRCALLRHTQQPWELWFQAAGLCLTEARSGRSFDDAILLLEAAANGDGIALARRSLLEADLTTGRLKRLWKLSIKDVHSHFIVWRPDSAKFPAIDALRTWLHGEALSFVPGTTAARRQGGRASRETPITRG